MISFMQVLQAPNEKLRVVTKPVKKITPALLLTIKEMVALTKTFKDPEGVGLASTQVGLDERFFVAKEEELEAKVGEQKASKKHSDKFIVIINPKILSKGKKTKTYFEGCLSIPNYWGDVKRHYSIKVSYMDETGQEVKKTLTGFMAWVFQHEVDHLDGILFPDRVLEQEGKFYKFVGKDKTGTDNFQEVTL
jgi:peptide deformylase